MPVSAGPRYAAAGLRLLDPDEDEVAVEGRPGAAAGDGSVGDARLAREEPGLPLAADGDPAGRQVRVLDEGELLAAGPDDEPLPLEGVDLGSRRASRAASSGDGPRRPFARSRKERMRCPRGERAARTRFSGVSGV